MRQLDRVVELLRDVLGADLVGAYLFGSAVAGGLRPRSDLDVLAVAAHGLEAEQKADLIRGLLPLSAGSRAPTPTKRWVEVTVVARPAVRPWRYPPPMELQYGDWWRTRFESGDLGPWEDPNPDLAILLAMALRASRPLVGPPLDEVLDPVPMADVIRATARTTDDVLRDLDGDTRNVLLTLARSWATVVDRTFLSKDEAATWAIARLPVALAAPLERARDVYLSGGADRWDDAMPDVRAAVERMVEEIRRSLPGG